MTKQGRPPVDPALIAKALALHDAGMSVVEAAEYVGVSKSSLYRKKNAPGPERPGGGDQAEQTAACLPTTVPPATTHLGQQSQ